MKLVIYDHWYNESSPNFPKSRIIEKPEFVPRVGDYINLGYAPAPKVEKVIFSFEHNIIYVDCRK